MSKGIFLEGTGKCNIIGNRTVCDICGVDVASKYFWKDEQGFSEYLEKSRLKKFVGRIHVIGVCEKCLGKVRRVGRHGD